MTETLSIRLDSGAKLRVHESADGFGGQERF
jgi:hypothetical protein